MKRTTILPAFFISFLLLLASCSKNEGVSTREPNLQLKADYNSGPVHSQAGPATNATAALGRVLFYDRRLSRSNSVSCASCHKQENSFAVNANNSLGEEKNAHGNGLSVLDGKGLEAGLLMPSGHIEAGMENLSDLTKKLKSAPYYSALFTSAFGTPDISNEKIGMAVAQFIKSTSNSKYDIGVNNGFTDFTSAESEGMKLFSSLQCKSCHGSNDGGSAALAPNAGPTLRNISATGPYMHDGSFKTLDEALVHNQAAAGISNEQREALKSFVLTLRNDQLVSDPKFSDPFN
jgi:cytochrome c peroxidase